MLNIQFVIYLINIINYQTLCPNPYSRLGCGMILKSASAFEDNNDEINLYMKDNNSQRYQWHFMWHTNKNETSAR